MKKLLSLFLIAAFISCSSFPANPQVLVTSPSNVREAVFKVQCYDSKNDQELGWGSGVSIKRDFVTNKITILTAKHVLEGCEDKGALFIIISDHRYPVKSQKVSENYDLALVYVVVEGPVSIRVTNLALHSGYEGDDVFAAGYPAPRGTYQITKGVINNKRTESSLDNKIYVQTTTEIYPGSSGGPLLNQYAEIIGIVVQISSTSFPIPSQRAYSVPLENVQEFLNKNNAL